MFLTEIETAKHVHHIYEKKCDLSTALGFVRVIDITAVPYYQATRRMIRSPQSSN